MANINFLQLTQVNGLCMLFFHPWRLKIYFLLIICCCLILAGSSSSSTVPPPLKLFSHSVYLTYIVLSALWWMVYSPSIKHISNEHCMMSMASCLFYDFFLVFLLYSGMHRKYWSNCIHMVICWMLYMEFFRRIFPDLKSYFHFKYLIHRTSKNFKGPWGPPIFFCAGQLLQSLTSHR